MYEAIVTWGIETLKDLAKRKVDEEFTGNLTIINEAIKTKNALVIKRFDCAWTAVNRLYELALAVQSETTTLATRCSDPNQWEDPCGAFMTALIKEIHEPNYAKFRQLRSQFEATNEILSWYSLELSRAMLADKLSPILNLRAPTTVTVAAEAYGQVWILVASILQALIRITSQDLRFWLSEIPHSKIAANWAKADVRRMETYIETYTSEKRRVNTFLLEIEEDGAVAKFWEQVHEKKSRKNA